jgi:DMSO reductase anchor subunit
MKGRGRLFHEMPLVAFTTLAIGGAGAAAVRPATIWLHGTYPPEISGRIAIALIGAGLAVSFLHLGRKIRGWRALSRVGRSPLSTEIAAAVAALLALAAGLQWIAAAAALVFLFSLGLVYRIRGQVGWGWESVAVPLVLGAAFGLSILFDGARREVLLLLAIDLLLAYARWVRLAAEAHRGSPAHPRLFAVRRRIALARTVTVTVLPALAVMLSGAAAGVLLAAGILIDRFSFYALALQRTTEAEIRRVERLWSAKCQ